MNLSANGLIIELSYVVAAGLFIFGLKLLGSAATARKGNTLSSLGMLIAIVAALLEPNPGQRLDTTTAFALLAGG